MGEAAYPQILFICQAMQYASRPILNLLRASRIKYRESNIRLEFGVYLPRRRRGGGGLCSILLLGCFMMLGSALPF